MSRGRSYLTRGIVPDEWYYHTLSFLHPLGAFPRLPGHSVGTASVWNGGRRPRDRGEDTVGAA